MRLGIISDIHGNLPALEAVAEQLRGVDQVICLGDVVNYGPWSNECLDFLQTLPRLILLEGNHEALFLGREDPAGELLLVQQFYRTTVAGFDRHEAIRDLPLEWVGAGYLFRHTLDGLKIYPNTPFVPLRDSVIGHSHCAFKSEREGRRLINPGSVGQNRTALERACFAILDSESGEIELRETTYPVRLLLSEMRARSYPAECLAYYQSKL